MMIDGPHSFPQNVLPPPLFASPRGASAVEITCKCGCKFHPSWSHKLNTAATEPQSGVECLPSPITIAFGCPQCAAVCTLLVSKSQRLNGVMDFYGDEAERWLNKEETCCFFYAFFHAPYEQVWRIQSTLLKVKQEIKLNEDPEAWFFYTTDFFNGHWRHKNNVLLNSERVVQLMNEIAAALRDRQDRRIIAVTVSRPFPIKRADITEEVKNLIRDEVVRASMCGLTDMFASQGWGGGFHT